MERAELRRQRQLRGWSKERAAAELSSLAVRRGFAHPGVDGKAIGRWEDGRTRPVFYAPLLCELYEKSAEELGLVKMTEIIDPMERRSFLRGAGAGALGFVTGQVGASQLEEALDYSAKVDQRMLEDLETIVRGDARQIHSLGPRSLLPGVRFRLGHLYVLLNRPQAPGTRRRLQATTGQAAAIAGKLSFALGNLGDAQTHYRDAEALARESGDVQLCAYVLGQRSHLHSSLFAMLGVNTGRALTLLDEAIATADSTSWPLLCVWLFVRRAEEHATRKDEAACRRDLDTAEALLGRAVGTDGAFLAHWDTAAGARLAGYRGSCAQLLGIPAEAIIAIEAGLKEVGPSWISVRSSMLTDLAAAYAQKAAAEHEPDADQACALLNESLDLASGADLGVYVNRVASVRRQLTPWAATAAVKQLDGRLQRVL